MRYAIIVTVEAEAELQALEASDFGCYCAALELLLQLEESQDVLADLMLEHTDADDEPTFEVKHFLKAQRMGLNLFILKFYTLEGELASHRIIYAFNPQEAKYHVLSIVPRTANYDQDQSWFQALVRRYDEAGIPRFKF